MAPDQQHKADTMDLITAHRGSQGEEHKARATQQFCEMESEHTHTHMPRTIRTIQKIPGSHSHTPRTLAEKGRTRAPWCSKL